MKYIGLSFQYMKRRFGSTLLYGILPALVFALTSSPTSIFNAIISIKDNPSANFLDVWLSATELSLSGFLFVILSGLLLIIFASAFTGMMERDMRLGDLTHRKFFTRVNNNFIIIFKVFLVFVLYLELFGVVNASLIYLWHKVFDNRAVFVAMSFVSLGILTIVAVIVACLGILWIPTMMITGLNMRKSLVESLVLIKGKVLKTALAVILPVIPFFALVMVCNYFDIQVLSFFVSLLLNLFVIGYYLILMFVIYFDATGMDREDLKKKIWEVNK